MKLRVGFEMLYEFPQPTPMLMVLGTHFTRASDVIVPDLLTTRPSVAISPYRDLFGNWCSRIVAPAGAFRLAGDGVVSDSGLPDPVFPNASQHAVEALPADTLVYLLGSRYCETDRLSDIAWKLFEHTPPGWARVQAICDFVHRHIAFGYEHARPTKSAREAYDEGKGVCRDYAHLAITFCRCMNIPARYCTGYLSDIGTPKPWARGRFRRLVRGLSRWKLAHVRSAQQYAADRPRADRTGTRRRGRPDHPDIRSEHPAQFQGMDRRGCLMTGSSAALSADEFASLAEINSNRPHPALAA
ncbi:transglutaminase-like putative cysteine protease [Bradyrhizobium sp. LM6.11]